MPDVVVQETRQVYYPGKANQKMGQILRRVNSVLDNERIAKTIESLEQDGIKTTISKVGIAAAIGCRKPYLAKMRINKTNDMEVNIL